MHIIILFLLSIINIIYTLWLVISISAILGYLNNILSNYMIIFHVRDVGFFVYINYHILISGECNISYLI